jgi:hypothetical protein
VDLFYDGSADVPLPFEDGAGPADRGRHSDAPCFCESCSAPVTAEDLARGAATEVYGLTLCEACRVRSRAEDRVELYFCDRCQVSVPVYRVDTGEALSGDGRILCVACREEAHRTRWAAAAVVAVLLLALGMAGVLLTRPPVVPAPAAPAGNAAEELLAGRVEVERGARLAELTTKVETAIGRIEALEAARDDIDSKLAAAADLLRRTREEFGTRMDVLEGETRTLLDELTRALERPIPER